MRKICIMVELPQNDEVRDTLKEIERLKKAKGNKRVILALKNKLLFMAMEYAKKQLESEGENDCSI